MSFLGKEQVTDRYGVVIDIGSGSVLTSIVHSNPQNNQPSIVWSHREPAPLKNIDSLQESSKAIVTALMNSSILLDSEGRKTLNEYDKKAQLTQLQCGISAPWSYTVTKKINYKPEQSFVITEELTEELVSTIQEKTWDELSKDKTWDDMGLTITTEKNLGILANGYKVAEPEGEEADELIISHTSVAVQSKLVEAVDEMHSKLFTKTEPNKISFILMLYSVTQKLFAQTLDLCLIDVTYEATEIGIVRNGILTYSTHTPFGIYSLAREISEITKIPLTEAFGHLHTEKPYSFIENLSKVQVEQVEQVFDSYVDKLTELFKQTGDSLQIPNKVILHTEQTSEPLLTDLLEKAAKRSIKTTPNIVLLSSKLTSEVGSSKETDPETSAQNDIALYLSAQFFHNQNKQ